MVLNSTKSSGNSAPVYNDGLAGRLFFGRFTDNPLGYLARQNGDGVAQFVAERLQYNSGTGHVGDLLGRDADSLTSDTAGKRAEFYGLRLDGQIYLEAGTHRFANTTDDGFSLKIDGKVVADYLGVRNAATTTGTVKIDKAGWYDIGIDYYQASGIAKLEIMHSLNGGKMKVLETGSDRLRHPAGDGTGQGDQNIAPDARNDSFTLDEDGRIRMDLLANDRDANGDRLSISALGQPENGRVVLNDDGTVTYRPNADFHGQDSFAYTISDGRGGTDTARVTLTVKETFVPPAVDTDNRAPVAVNDQARVNEDGSVRINLLRNDTDPDGDRLDIRSLGRPDHGTVVDNGDGTVTYRPDADFHGRDSFTYRVSDGNGGTSQATVSVNVTPVNDAPVAVDDSGYSVDARGSLHISTSDLLANDRDVDGDELTIIGVENVSGGSARMMGDGIHFTAGSAGTATFDYILSDGNGGTDRARVTIDVGGGGTGGNGGNNSGGGNGNGNGNGGNGGHGGNHGDGPELIDPPRTAAEIRAFVQQVRNAPEDGAHHPNATPDHDGALKLVPRAEATHIAINHGDWNDASTWHNGQVPGADAQVLIPKGIAVSYSEVNAASLHTVRVDGVLDFATDQDSRMLVDTMVVSKSGHLIMGTEDNPVWDNVNIDIVFADNGNIDTGWDPALLSRGLLSQGSVSIHGAEKDSHVKVEVDAMAGATRLTLSEVPDGWRVGDKLVLTGTHQQGWNWNNNTKRMEKAESQDEEVTIKAINGNQIVLERPLAYDHDTPRDDLKAYVANMTRNITFSSEGGDDLPVHQRGHVMFMHSDNVDVRYAGFEDLGRTDKSRPAFDIKDLGGPGAVSADANIQTRYPFHFHETGVSDLENPAMAVGNVVDGSPGWGYVHHSSNANFTNNVAFDVFGAGFVAEDGNETGIWYRNIAINSQGIAFGDHAVKDGPDVERGDNGRTGDGFFFAGRLVEAAENVAANTNNGYVWFHRGERDAVDMNTSHHPELGYGQETSSNDRPPIQGFHDNEAFGTHSGLIVIKANPDQGHDVRSVFDGFLNWETREGLNVSYTSHYTFLDIDLIGQRGTNGGFSDAAMTGVMLGTNAFDMVVNGIKVQGFQNAFNLRDNNTPDDQPGRGFNNTIIDADISNIKGATTLQSYAGQLTIMQASQLVSDRLSFDFTGDRIISARDDIFFTGTKHDSIGSIDRIFAIEKQGIWDWQKDEILNSNGYHRLPDGTPVLLVSDYISDRATGELSKHTLVFQLDLGAHKLSEFTDNGVVRLGGPAPNVTNDRATTGMNQSIRLDLVANDRDPDGGRVYVDGLTDPRHGDVYMQDDGTVLYRPNLGYTGTDSFYYWAADEEGNFTRGKADIVVTESALMQSMIGADTLDF